MLCQVGKKHGSLVGCAILRILRGSEFSSTNSEGRRTYSKLLQDGFEESVVVGKNLEDLVIMAAEVDEYRQCVFGYGLSRSISTVVGRKAVTLNRETNRVVPSKEF